MCSNSSIQQANSSSQKAGAKKEKKVATYLIVR
uniref:Uncharacterized protein n=1 Tax=Arundo donax TaxID=35708 RepID=A0A0A9BWE4_ARUDO